jgi:phospholipase/lecithinase/hemolysin
MPAVGTWRSLVAHLHGVQRVGGSNPLVPTISLWVFFGRSKKISLGSTYKDNGCSYRLKTQHDYQNGHLLRIKDANVPATVFWQANATDAAGAITEELRGINAALTTGLKTVRTVDAVTRKPRPSTAARRARSILAA